MDFQTLDPIKLSLHEAQFLEDLLKTGVPECKKDLLWHIESIVYELKLQKSHQV